MDLLLPPGKSSASRRSCPLAGSYSTRLAYSCRISRRNESETAWNSSRRSRLATIGIGDVEHHLHAVALAGQFRLITLRGFVVENVLHRHGHLAGRLAPETQGPRRSKAEDSAPPSPMAPKRRCAVVSGSTQQDRTPCSRSNCMIFG